MNRVKSLKPTEAEIHRQIKEVLTRLGYVVLDTSRKPKRCPSCGAWGRSGAGDGVSKGTPDLFVTHPAWRFCDCAWIGLEVKRPGGRLRPEQAELERQSLVYVVHSVDEALAAVGR